MKKYIHLLLVTVLLSLTVSCTKTEYEETKFPYQEITQFAIKGFTADEPIQAVILGDELLIYWDKAVAIPETITPVITVSDRATVFPASGQTVKVDDNLHFVVTAEDATTKTYKVRFVLQQPDPIVLSAPNAPFLQWFSGSPLLTINGQYFLAGGDPDAIRVYARRAKDGFEFDLNITQVKSTMIQAKLPDFTVAMDTGRHDIKLIVGTKAIDVVQGHIKPHPLLPTNLILESPLNKSITAGEEIKFRLDEGELKDRILKYYSGKCSGITFYHVNQGEYKQVTITDFKQENNTISFKFPTLKFAEGDHIELIMFTYPSHDGKGGTSVVSTIQTAADRIYLR